MPTLTRMNMVVIENYNHMTTIMDEILNWVKPQRCAGCLS